MEIYLDKRAVKQIRLSAADAIEEGDTETLKDDIVESFPEEHVETIEEMLSGNDLIDLVGEILLEWSGDDVDELFELLETQLADQGIDLKLYSIDDDGDDPGDDESSNDDYDDYGDYDEPDLDEDDDRL